MAKPLHRHQSSLQGFLDFSSATVLEPSQFSRATEIFNQLISRYEPLQAASREYRHITLLRTVHESIISKGQFLRLFFLFLEADLRPEQDIPGPNLTEVLSRFDDLNSWSCQQSNELQRSLLLFSDYVVDNFFLPLKASGLKTPQPTPVTLSATQTPNQVIGTTQRLAHLRQQCLIRDRYKCVISRKFDLKEAMARWARDGHNSKDDDGHLLSDTIPEDLEVAHILPHSLTSLSGDAGNPQLNESKRIALQILNMFDPGIGGLIEGPDIDRSTNAITLTLPFHRRFGNFEVSFEPTADQAPHSYKIDYVNPDRPFRDPLFPVNRQLYITPDKTVDPPSPRLLAIHHAIARILYLSGAGDCIDRIIRDMEEVGVREDGSTELGRYVRLKLGGWQEGVPVC